MCFAGAVGEMSRQVTAGCTAEMSSAEMSGQPGGPASRRGARVWNANRQADGMG